MMLLFVALNLQFKLFKYFLNLKYDLGTYSLLQLLVVFVVFVFGKKKINNVVPCVLFSIDIK